MKVLSVILLCFTAFSLNAQKMKQEVEALRDKHFQEMNDSTAGILTPAEIADFQGLEYFEFNPRFQIQGTFTEDIGKKFKMPTTTDRLPVYRRYGYVEFEFQGKKCRLEVYQNMALRKQKEYKNYLFIPFRDLSSGNESYGGGRYLDVVIPEGESMLLDFNLAYNPYCAYSHRYSCPIPPEVNTLKILVEAGEKTPPGH
jgi:hypothetical protein